MKSLISITLLIIAAKATKDKPHYNLNDAPALFEKFIKDYNRHYENEADKQVHFEAFKKSLELINESNALSKSATFDINGLADYTTDELKRLLGVLPNNPFLNRWGPE